MAICTVRDQDNTCLQDSVGQSAVHTEDVLQSTIMNLLSLANEDSVPGADDFVPVLVFVLIKVGLLIVSDSSCGLLSRVIDRFKSLEGDYFQNSLGIVVQIVAWHPVTGADHRAHE